MFAASLLIQVKPNAIEHGATPGSFDRDFERFAGLDFEAPPT